MGTEAEEAEEGLVTGVEDEEVSEEEEVRSSSCIC